MTRPIRPILEWLRVWWGLITGVWLIAVSIALLILGALTFATQRDQEQLGRNIQTERAESIRVSCYEQNGRNRKAVLALRTLTTNPHAIKRTVLLIDALAPVRNCVELAEQRVRAR